MNFDFLPVLVVYFFNWLLSFFWFCKEAKCFFLCLYLGWNFPNNNLLIIFMAELAMEIVPLVLFQTNCHLLYSVSIPHGY